MGGGKKRKSVNKSSGAEQNADTKKRIVHSNGNDSDYGVFSDPDEASDDKQPQSPQSPTSPHSHIVELSYKEPIIEAATKAATTNVVIQEDEDNTDKVSPEVTKSIITLDKSLDTLKMKLEKDPVYSNKTTLTSFFSYIILAMEIDIVCASTITTVESTAASANNPTNTERLIEYIIRNHSSTPEVEQYTLTMLQLGVITHIINGVIEFNITVRASTNSSNHQNHSHTLQTLQSLEQLHLNHKKMGETDIIATSPSSDLAESAAKQSNGFIRFLRNMSLCCCKCRKSRKESILENNSNNSNDTHKSDEDATTKQPSTKKSEEDIEITQSKTGEEMKELTI